MPVSDVLDTHTAFKDTSRLHLCPLPIDYTLEVFQKQYLSALTWDDLPEEKVTLRLSDDDGTKDTRKVYCVADKLMCITRFCVELADLKKEHRKKGRIVSKNADVTGAEAMMAAMSIKKKKKKKKDEMQS